MNHISMETTGLDVTEPPTMQDIITKPHQLRWGDREMGTTISSKKTKLYV